ncbi:MAG: phage major tail tube protein [Sphingobium sp.]|uniref:phage major tail tube protein n=1 Tax=Sphingobium sp. TaxID=1912891 RepID=UPI003BAFD4C6
MLPSKLKNFNLHDNGNSFLHQVAEIALPKIAEKVEGWRGGGMMGELDVGLGLEKMEMETTIGGLAIPILRRFGIVGVAGQMMRFNGAYQEEGSGTVAAAELVVRGKHVEIDPGTAKPGDDTAWKIKSTLSYVKWTINGRVEVEIDILNNIMLIDGFDRMAQIRAALDGSASLGIGISAGGIGVSF